MREIIVLGVGQFGINLAEEFYQQILPEHSLNYQGNVVHSSSQNDHKDPLFAEVQEGKYVPRALLVDTDPLSVAEVREGPLAKFFDHSNLVSGWKDSGRNHAVAYMNESDLVDSCWEKTRKLLDRCDSFQGFLILNATSGGTGSGITNKFLETCEEFRSKLFVSLSLVNQGFGEKTQQGGIESMHDPYNDVFGLYYLNKFDCMTICCENRHILNLCQRNLRILKPNLCDVNCILGQALNQLTAPMRFPSNCCNDFRKLATNLIPFKNRMFLTMNQSNMQARMLNDYVDMSPKQISMRLFDKQYNLMDVNYKNSVNLSSCQILRGCSTNIFDIQTEIKKLKERRKMVKGMFCDYLPSVYQSIEVNAPFYLQIDKSKTVDISSQLLNSSIIANPFKKITDRFTTIFRRKVNLHLFTQTGMDEMEFTEAESGVNDVISDYQQLEKDVLNEDDEEEEEGAGE